MVKLSQELAFYGAYHSNFVNQLIHIVFVPMLLWSAFILVGLTSRQLSFATWVAYALFFIFLEPFVGSLAALFYLVLWFTADRLFVVPTMKQGPKGVATMSKSYAFGVAIAAQVLGWGMQVAVGHAIFERRKPALLDSLFQAFSLAPLFVVYEVVWLLVPGFRPELKSSVDQQVAQMHAAWAVSS